MEGGRLRPFQMNMKRGMSTLFGGRLQSVLIASFTLVAMLSVGLGAWVISRVIDDYLADAESRRVNRDMNLAITFYQSKLDEVTAVARRLAMDPLVIDNLPAALRDRKESIERIDQTINRKITVPTVGGTHFVSILDTKGNIRIGRVISPEGRGYPFVSRGNWGELPIVADALASGEGRAATEVVPAEFLAQVGLDEQAVIPLIETPLASPRLFDPRESTAGLTLTAVFPVRDNHGESIGAILISYLFNRDFTLVDRVKEAAGVDTVTIFLGDLRVSTNVLTETGERAIGTRLSQDVYDIVLGQGLKYVGRAFVVKEWFITQYLPLRDHRDQVVGILYVGAREATFQALVSAFNKRVALIALICMLLAIVLGVLISRFITRPIVELAKATHGLEEGDMTVRVRASGGGELALLGRSFNTMVETLRRTQNELVQKERLASMGQLAAGVAHEINNPLGTILLFSDIMFKSAAENDPRRDDLEMIIKETNRCKRIVAALLNFARQQDVLVKKTDVHAVLEEAIEKVRRQPSFEKIEIAREFHPDLPLIQADPAQLEQVFINLLNNASEAMAGDGLITLTTRPGEDQRVEIRISDTGCGIPKENLDQLFTPFFTTKPAGKGVGLGLAIVYGIIKMHRGQIQAQSQVGRGTTFTMTLPVQLSPMT